MANPTLFNTRAAALPAADARNEAGGKAYALSAKHALAQYAVTGCLNGTFYADAQEQLDAVLRLCGQVPAKLNRRDSILTNEQKLAGLPSGGTKCSAPLAWLNRQQAKEGADILNVGGFSDAVFKVIARFAAGKLEDGHWVRTIEQYSGPFV